mmetsp:Transcript_34830/g.48303  ORF Transcript_34830/g.48303 Transcript_34830/m.48303 type:complete len:223 (+) Transcript_34830:1204-1872(+)
MELIAVVQHHIRHAPIDASHCSFHSPGPMQVQPVVVYHLPCRELWLGVRADVHEDSVPSRGVTHHYVQAIVSVPIYNSGTDVSISRLSRSLQGVVPGLDMDLYSIGCEGHAWQEPGAHIRAHIAEEEDAPLSIAHNEVSPPVSVPVRSVGRRVRASIQSRALLAYLQGLLEHRHASGLHRMRPERVHIQRTLTSHQEMVALVFLRGVHDWSRLWRRVPQNVT